MDQPSRDFPEPLVAAYIGTANSPRYARAFHRFQGRGLWWPPGFNAAALLWPLGWALYRRLTGLAIVVGLLRLSTLMALLLTDLVVEVRGANQLLALLAANAVVNAWVATVADRALYARGLRMVTSLRRAGLCEADLAEQLRHRGGTRGRIAAVFAGVALGTALAVAAFGIRLYGDYQARVACAAGYELVEGTVLPRLAGFMDQTGRCPSASAFTSLFDPRALPPSIDAVLVPWDSGQRSAQQGCAVVVHFSATAAMSRRIAGSLLQLSISRQKDGSYRRACTGTAAQHDLNFSDAVYCQHVDRIEPFRALGAGPAAVQP